MSAIQNIARYRKPLIGAELIFVTLFAGELFYLHTHGTLQLGRIQLAAALLPPLGAWLCFFPLFYWSWFRQTAMTSFRTVKLIFFWAIVGGSSLIWLNILWLSLGPKA